MVKNLTLFLLLIPYLSKSCTCYQSKSFNLYDFDKSDMIIEVEVLSEIKKQIREIEVKSDVPSLVFLNKNKEYKVKVVSYFKGEKFKFFILKTNDVSSSCFWQPQLGKKYILYLNHSKDPIQQNTFQMGDCERKICSDESNYTDEKKALKMLGKAKSGTLKIFYQNNIILEGVFQKRNRHGEWILYEPIVQGSEVSNENSKTVSLTYFNNHLTKVEYRKPISKFTESAFTLNWLYYYQSALNGH